MMDQLRLNEGDLIRIQGGRYPKGKLVKLQAQSVDFLEISDHKTVCVFNFFYFFGNSVDQVTDGVLKSRTSLA